MVRDFFGCGEPELIDTYGGEEVRDSPCGAGTELIDVYGTEEAHEFFDGERSGELSCRGGSDPAEGGSGQEAGESRLLYIGSHPLGALSRAMWTINSSTVHFSLQRVCWQSGLKHCGLVSKFIIDPHQCLQAKFVSWSHRFKSRPWDGLHTDTYTGPLE